VGEGGDMKFEKRSKYNYDFPSIPSIVGKIIVCALEKGEKITEISIRHLLSALDSNDKQTKILSAKALHIITNRHDYLLINEDVLKKMR
jgi:hypothetical protein